MSNTTTTGHRIEHTKGLGCNHFAAFHGEVYVGTYYTEKEASEAIDRMDQAYADAMSVIRAGGDSRLQYPMGGGCLFAFKQVGLNRPEYRVIS